MLNPFATYTGDADIVGNPNGGLDKVKRVKNTYSNRPLTPDSKLVLDLPTPKGRKAELTYRLYPAMHRPGVKLAISRLQVQRPNHCTTEPPLLSSVENRQK